MEKLLADKILTILISLRPNQWYKNLVVFAALFFSGNLLDLEKMITVVIGFLALCLLSSGSYVLNDIIDIERDKNHEKKSKRPIASGRISVFSAVLISALCYLAGIFIAWKLGPEFLACGFILVSLTLLYIFIFREVAFADIVVLSTNFILRAIAGAVAINVFISPWLILGTFLVALFLSTSKRKADLISLGEAAHNYKSVFKTYTIQLLDSIIIMVTTSLLITYTLFTFQSTANHSQLTIASIPVVFYIVFRYYSYTLDPAKPEFKIAQDPELVFLKDKQIVAAIGLWILIIVASFYLN